MGVRRQAREIAVQILYSLEFREDCESSIDIFQLPEVEPLFQSISPGVKAYASILVSGVISQRLNLDRYLSLSSLNWSLYRMARVDRAILRVGVYEILAVSDVPPYVAINEALEVAKVFSSDEAPMYINGVLDRVTVLLQSEGLMKVEEKNSLEADSSDLIKIASQKS